MDESTLVPTRLQGLPAFSFNAAADELQGQALASSALISKVESADENALAVAAQTELRRVQSLLEKAIAPYIDGANEYKKAVWKERDRLNDDLQAELTRVSTLIGDFQTLEQAKARALEKLRLTEQTRLEKERAEAEAKAANHEQLDAVQAHYNQKAADLAERIPSPPAIRAQGQTVKNDWDITIIDPRLLAYHFPHCVTVTPKLGEIKKLLAEDIIPIGVKATPIIRAGVRLPKEKGALAV